MSSGAGFPINDLTRRRLQTGLVITTLTLSVASTLFLLLFSDRLGVGLVASTDTFTLGLSATFGQFLTFIGILIFLVGAVLTSFIVFLMMAQRTRDFGLIKAAGCPNSLVGGYFMTELLTVTSIGCILGVVFGFLADFTAANLVFGAYSMGNWWFAPIVFAVFFVLALVFGLRPIIKASKMSAIEALSPINYYGLAMGSKHKALSHSALTWRIASRSLFRRQSATLRIVVLLSIVFILLTVSVAGGIIAKDTTTSWVNSTVDRNSIVVAHGSMGVQYELLLQKFSGAKDSGDYNYSDPKLTIPSTVSAGLTALSSVNSVNPRLVLYETVGEISNFTVIDGAETYVGDSRKGEVLIIGLDPKTTNNIPSKGRNLSGNGAFEAVIGDSVAQKMYSPDPAQYIRLSDPLVEGIQIENKNFRIVGINVDPINNGLVAYVPIDRLMNATGIANPNLIVVNIADSADRNSAITEIHALVKAADPGLDVFDLSQTVEQNEAFLGATWQAIMFLPLFTVASAALCMVGYMMLSIDEQRPEFAMLRAVGARPRLIINISAIQGAIVLFSSFGTGISLGTIITVMILMANPVVTTMTVVVISGWLLSALIVMFGLSLYPAFRLAKTAILRIAA